MDIITKEMSLEDAKKTGAMALFSEKYDDLVRVVSMGDFSVELCGGTHVSNTSQISMFKIVSESGVAAGVRRIEALTGTGVLSYYETLNNCLQNACKAAKAEPEQLTKKIEALQEEIKALQGENASLKSKAASSSLGDVMSQVEEINGIKVLAVKVEDTDMNGLRDLGDQLKNKLQEAILLLASSQEGKVSLVAMATKGAMDKGGHAGNLIKEVASLVGGGGGGRPNMAQAGGKNPAGIDHALAKAKEVMQAQLEG